MTAYALREKRYFFKIWSLLPTYKVQNCHLAFCGIKIQRIHAEQHSWIFMLNFSIHFFIFAYAIFMTNDVFGFCFQKSRCLTENDPPRISKKF